MLSWVITASLRHRLAVIAGALILLASGVTALLQLPIDAFPDTTPVQVQINTIAPALNATEAEQQITAPIEQAITGLPGMRNLRSVSKFGLSQVVATFNDDTPVYQARQFIAERLQTVDLPEGISRPELGPISSGLGEVFHYSISSTNPARSLLELRELQDWVIKPELRKVPGVAEINSWGGFQKQFEVLADPEQLIKHGVTFEQLFEALESNNQNVGGGQLTRGGESLLVHGLGAVSNLSDIRDIVIASRNGLPLKVGDVAGVRLGHEIRHGAVTARGKGEIVLGLGFMLMGENSAAVARGLRLKLAETRRMLPPDVQVEVLYDRTELVGKVIRTVEHNLLAGALLVVAVLFAFLGNIRGGLIVALAIPFSMLMAGQLMWQAGIAASLLSLGAIDFGLIVDSSVIQVENCIRRATEQPERPRLELVRDAAIEVRRPALFGELIMLIVFVPVLALEGVEGKMFRPLALTMMFALAGSLVFSLVLVPVLASFGLPLRAAHKEPWVSRAALRLYRPVLNWAIGRPRLILASGLALIVLAVLIGGRLGGEFLPKLGEGAIVATTVRLAGVSVEESAALNTRLEAALLKEFPHEISDIWTRLGTAEVATDPMGIELSDFFITLRPRGDWQKARSQSEVVDRLRALFSKMPGMTVAFSQPIEMRLNEMIAGIRADVGLKIYGDELGMLKTLSEQAQRVLASVPGAVEPATEQLVGQPVLEVRARPETASRFGVPVRSVLNVVETIGTRKVGMVREGQRRFPLVVRLPERERTNAEALRNMLIPTETGPVLPLSQLAEIRETIGPSTINREWGRRRATLQCDVAGRDLAGFVAEARKRIVSEVKLPEGYSIEWGGQFENMERANRRLAIVVPAALGLVFTMLFFSLGSMRSVCIVASGIPLGALGGLAALWLRDMPLTVSAAIGFIALSGVAILNGLVLVTFIHQRLIQGEPLIDSVKSACLTRLRPVLMTALVAAAGFIPMAFNVGVGGEVQRPLATVVIGGILSNTALTLLVLPALFVVFGRTHARINSGSGADSTQPPDCLS